MAGRHRFGAAPFRYSTRTLAHLFDKELDGGTCSGNAFAQAWVAATLEGSKGNVTYGRTYEHRRCTGNLSNVFIKLHQSLDARGKRLLLASHFDALGVQPGHLCHLRPLSTNVKHLNVAI